MQECSVNNSTTGQRRNMRYARSGSLPITLESLSFTASGTLLAAKEFFSLTILISASHPVYIRIGNVFRPFDNRDSIFVAANFRNYAWHCAGEYRLLCIDAPVEALSERLNLDKQTLANALASLQGQVLKDPELRAYCTSLWQNSQLTQDNSLATLAVDQSLLALATVLMMRANLDFDTSSQRSKKGELDPRRLKRVEAFIDASLKDSITLAELADVAALSVGHFTRAFKTTKGKSPHQYVIDKRVQRAKELLQQDDISILEITSCCGFASQSHMTNVFRTKVGMTPGNYRQMIRENYSIAV